MAKRSPILGYNHNVRYRGVVFHVQTEDSGLLNPHLFTHLFHEGVIVSTRKLVYDAGSNEDAIKALMQAQHKAVMKDLRKGTFDEKIDQYLGGTPGLEPRRGADPTQKVPRGERAATEADAQVAQAALDSAAPLEIVHEDLSEPIELPLKKSSAGVPTQARADTGDRTIPVTALPPMPGEEDAATETPGTDAPAKARTTTAQKVSKTKTTATDIGRAPTKLATQAPAASRDSEPIIEIDVDDDEIERHRGPRDTAVEEAIGLPTTPHRHTRPPSHGAAALPAMKPPSRPISPVVTRPPTQERKRKDSDVVEVYSPPPPSVEPPPGERAERPGQYSMSRREGAAIREKTGRLAAVAPSPPSTPPAVRSRSNAGSGSSPVVPAPGARQGAHTGRQAGQPPPIPQGARSATPVAGSRVPTPQPPGRVHVTAPIANRAPSPASSGVVMTRPAVIVGAPPKTPQTQRVRKAREDEGRGFGQGLISEKSLDEVILAYLSEDAEDK